MLGVVFGGISVLSGLRQSALRNVMNNNPVSQCNVALRSYSGASPRCPQEQTGLIP